MDATNAAVLEGAPATQESSRALKEKKLAVAIKSRMDNLLSGADLDVAIGTIESKEFTNPEGGREKKVTVLRRRHSDPQLVNFEAEVRTPTVFGRVVRIEKASPPSTNEAPQYLKETCTLISNDHPVDETNAGAITDTAYQLETTQDAQGIPTVVISKGSPTNLTAVPIDSLTTEDKINIQRMFDINFEE